jgi:hypothetical protein
MGRAVHRLLSGGAGAVAAPVIFLLCMSINYALVPWVCAAGHPMVLHGVTFTAVLLIGVAVWLSWRDMRQTKKQPSDTNGEIASRVRFTALLGLATSGLFLFIMLAQWLPQFILNPCEP